MYQDDFTLRILTNSSVDKIIDSEA